ncbi:MAG: N-acetyltransferase [Alphaproteobacteria bacterium]|nr:MAG: N-acetyltransferase [Alphaproteobacteria bacterium]
MPKDLHTWAACARPGNTALVGHYARLEPLDWAKHGTGLHAAVCGPDRAGLWDYLPFGPFADRAAFEAGFAAAARAGDWATMVIRSGNAADATITGMASYMRLREAHGSAEVGAVVFGPDLQKTRAATEAIYLMAAHVFDDLGYRRFEWKCNNANEASRRAAVRFGFRFEGVFRNDMVVKGKNRDTAWFAMTDDDWPDVRARFMGWLDPANFDETGQQQRPLAAQG